MFIPFLVGDQSCFLGNPSSRGFSSQFCWWNLFNTSTHTHHIYIYVHICIYIYIQILLDRWTPQQVIMLFGDFTIFVGEASHFFPCPKSHDSWASRRLRNLESSWTIKTQEEWLSMERLANRLNPTVAAKPLCLMIISSGVLLLSFIYWGLLYTVSWDTLDQLGRQTVLKLQGVWHGEHYTRIDGHFDAETHVLRHGSGDMEPWMMVARNKFISESQVNHRW